MLNRKERKITWKKGDAVFISGTSSSKGKVKRQQVLKINENFTFLVGGYRTLHKFIIPLPKTSTDDTTNEMPNVVKKTMTYVNKKNITHNTERERELEIEIQMQQNLIMELTSEMSNMKSELTTNN